MSVSFACVHLKMFLMGLPGTCLAPCVYCPHMNVTYFFHAWCEYEVKIQEMRDFNSSLEFFLFLLGLKVLGPYQSLPELPLPSFPQNRLSLAVPTCSVGFKLFPPASSAVRAGLATLHGTGHCQPAAFPIAPGSFCISLISSVAPGIFFL